MFNLKKSHVKYNAINQRTFTPFWSDFQGKLTFFPLQKMCNKLVRTCCPQHVHLFLPIQLLFCVYLIVSMPDSIKEVTVLHCNVLCSLFYLCGPAFLLLSCLNGFYALCKALLNGLVVERRFTNKLALLCLLVSILAFTELFFSPKSTTQGIKRSNVLRRSQLEKVDIFSCHFCHQLNL